MSNFKVYSQADIGFGYGKRVKEDGIQVWIVNWKSIKDFVQLHMSLLSTEEKKYISRYIRKEDRLRTATARVLINDILSCYERKVWVEKDCYGKPYIVGMPELMLSISHSGDMVMLALSFFYSVGVDVEQIKPIDDYESIAQYHFCLSEYKIIKQEKTIETFYKYWTVKEAYVKALGLGMYREFDSFEVELEKGRVNDSRTCSKANIGKIVDIDVENGYVASLVYV